MLKRSKLAAGAALLALAALVSVGYILAAAGDVTVTKVSPDNAPWTSNSIAFTLNGTTPVTATVNSPFAANGGSVEGTLASGPTGTVTLTAWQSDIFTSGQKDIVSENFASQKLQVGLFDAINTSATGYALAPGRITISIVSTSTADTAISGTVVVTTTR